MKFPGTYKDLFEYSVDLNNFAITHPAVSKLLAGGYERFEKHNQVHLDFVRKRISELYEQNVRKDEGTGQYKMSENGENWDFLSVMHENHFTEQWQELMSRPCTFIIGG